MAARKASTKASAKPNVSAEELLHYYREMLLIRRFEEKAGQLYGMGLIGGVCHLYIGQEAVVVGLEAAAEDASGEARELAHEMRDKRAMAEVERNLGLNALKRGDEAAEKTLVRALALAEEYGTREAIALAHRGIGQLRAQTLFDTDGTNRPAEESFLASIDTFREVGNEKEAARSLALLGYHLIELGDTETAIERLREARSIMRRIGVHDFEKVESTLADLGALSRH